MKEKTNGKLRDDYSSKVPIAPTAVASETFTNSKGSPAHASFSMSESTSDRKDPNYKTAHNFSKERKNSHDARHAKKHKRSKKKKSKDKEKHHDSGWVEI